MQAIKVTNKKENITLSVSIECDDEMTEQKKRDVCSQIATMSRKIYLDVAKEINDRWHLLPEVDR